MVTITAPALMKAVRDLGKDAILYDKVSPSAVRKALVMATTSDLKISTSDAEWMTSTIGRVKVELTRASSIDTRTNLDLLENQINKMAKKSAAQNQSQQQTLNSDGSDSDDTIPFLVKSQQVKHSNNPLISFDRSHGHDGDMLDTQSEHTRSPTLTKSQIKQVYLASLARTNGIDPRVTVPKFVDSETRDSRANGYIAPNSGVSTLSMIDFQMQIITGEAVDENGRTDVFDVNAAIETLGDIAAFQDPGAKQERELAEKYLVMLYNHPNVSPKISNKVMDTIVRNDRIISKNPSRNEGFAMSDTLSTIVKNDVEIKKTLETRSLQKPTESNLKRTDIKSVMENINHKIRQLNDKLVSLSSECFRIVDKLKILAPKYHDAAHSYIYKNEVNKFSEESAQRRFDFASQKLALNPTSETLATKVKKEKAARQVWIDIGKMLTQYNEVSAEIQSLYAEKRGYAEELAQQEQQEQQGHGKSYQNARPFRSDPTSFNSGTNRQTQPSASEERVNTNV